MQTQRSANRSWIPVDNTTILCAVDSAPGGIYRAVKVAPGNWYRPDPDCQRLGLAFRARHGNQWHDLVDARLQ